MPRSIAGTRPRDCVWSTGTPRVATSAPLASALIAPMRWPWPPSSPQAHVCRPDRGCWWMIPIGPCGGVCMIPNQPRVGCVPPTVAAMSVAYAKGSCCRQPTARKEGCVASIRVGTATTIRRGNATQLPPWPGSVATTTQEQACAPRRCIHHAPPPFKAASPGGFSMACFCRRPGERSDVGRAHLRPACMSHEPS
jgi:hypothetical protein